MEVGQIEKSLVIWVEAMRPLEYASKNGWAMADFSVIMDGIMMAEDEAVSRDISKSADLAFASARHTMSYGLGVPFLLKRHCFGRH
ncbi:hypothetical protein TNCV_3538781 [Trichonephila clavipes]|nr:hypothetical protein TNCV_3538781 [Trichonephila clavipes]